MNYVIKIMTKAKKRISVLLIVVMTLQSLLTSVNLVAMAAPSGADPEHNIFELKGHPEEAFEYIYVQLGDTVSGEGDELSVTYWYRLNNQWLENQFEKYLSEGLVDPYSFEFDDTYKDIKQTYGTYDEYLSGQTSVQIEAPVFTCSFDDGFADMSELMTILSASPDLYTEKGELIGKVTVADINGPQFHIQFNNTVFVRQNVFGNKGIAMKLLNQYEPGDKVEVEMGSGENSLEVVIKGEGTPLATDSNYSLEKDYQQGSNVNGGDDPSAINFHITAKATPASADVSTASNANAAVTATASIAALTDDELPADAQDISLEYDWWNMGLNAPEKSNITRDGQATESDLTGKYITDAISSNLVLDAAAVSYDGGLSWVFLSASEYGYDSWEEYLSDHNRLFAYRIEGDEENPVWQCEIILYTRIADKLWRQYAQTGVLDYEFTNRAVLKYEENSGTLAVSNKVKPEIHWYDMISKKGQIVDINGNKMRWNIHVDDHFNADVQLYLTDHIADITNTHNYIWDEDGQCTITINGDQQKVTKLTLTEEILTALAVQLGCDEADIWGELHYGAKDEDKGMGEARYGMPSISTIEALLNLLPEAVYNDGTHYAYEYVYENEDGETVTDTIMLISMKDYTNGKTTITYDTAITAVPDPGTGAYNGVVLGNDVRPVWKWDENDIGPGEMPTGEINVEKTWKIRTGAVNKSGDGYNDETNTIAWLFDVNQTGKTLDHVWIEDGLDARILTWCGLVEEKEPLQLVPYIRSPHVDEEGYPIDEEVVDGIVRQVIYVSPEDYESRQQEGTEDFYTVAAETGADGITRSVLKVHLGPIAADEYYKFRVQTLVVNPYYAQGADLLITNDATAKVMIDGNESEPLELWAEEALLHQLIDKNPINFDGGGNYNYEENTVKWRVVLNPKKFAISNGIVTDTLPLGTKFGEITSVTIDDEMVDWESVLSWEVAENQAAYPGDSSGKLYSKDTLKLQFTDISQTYVLEYTTIVTEDFRKEIIKSNSKAETLYNHVKLEGEIDGAAIVGAWSEAKHQVQPRALLKEGKYHALSSYIYYYYDDNDPVLKSREVKAVYFNWKAYINRLGENLAGATISDTLANCFELVPATLRVETVELDSAGQEKAVGQIIINHGQPVSGQPPLANLQLDEYGFSFDVPAEYGDKTLKITYDTILVDDAAAVEMKNAIDVKGAGWEDSTGEVTDKEAEDFRYSDYNNADGMYFLRLEKISINSNRDKLYLADAEFRLTKMELKSGAASDVTNWEETTRVKTRITNSGGVLNFLFVEPNTLYKLEESAPPAGYDQLTRVWYIAILDGTYGLNGAAAANKNNFPLEGISADGSYEVMLINDPEDMGPLHYKNLEIGNAPGNDNNTNEFVFRKLGQNGQILPGIKFLLTGPQMILSTSSDAEGKVRFEKLDPLNDGYYTLTELSAPAGYQQPGNWRVYVIFEDGMYQITLKERTEAGEWVEVVDKTADGSWQLWNAPIMNGGSFTKVDQNGDKLADFPVTFQVYRLGDGGTEEPDGSVTVDLGNNTGTYEEYLKKKTVSSSEGIITLSANDFYYGYYRLNEIWDQDIHGVRPVKPIYIKISESGVYAAKEGIIPSSDSDYTINLQNAGALKIENVIQWGTIDVNKALATYNDDTKEWEADQQEGNVIWLANMLFRVYRVQNGSRESSPFMYIKTDAQGNFVTNDSGWYKVYRSNGLATGSFRQLLMGTYELKEERKSGYIENVNYYPFEIVGGQFDAQGNYIPNDPVIISTQDNNSNLFLNKPARFPVNLKKVDKEYPGLALKHAKFKILNSGKKIVAHLVYENDSYKLIPEGAEVERDSAGRRYLEKAESGEYHLLTGAYTIVEIEPPDETFTDSNLAYPVPSDDMSAYLEVSEAGAKLTGGKLKQENANDTMVNSVKKGSFKLEKGVLILSRQSSEKPSAIGAYEYSTNSPLAAGFEFTLSGRSLPGEAVDAEEQTYIRKTNGSGTLLFDNIPVGTYKMEETDVPEEFKIDSSDEWIVEKVDPIWIMIGAKDNTSNDTTVTFFKDENCTQLLEDSENAEEASQAESSIGKNEEDSLMAYNALKTADVSGVKMSFYTDENGEVRENLKGVRFRLSHKKANYIFECITDENGRISFENIPYGTYALTEIPSPEHYYQPVSFEITISETTLDSDGVFQLNQSGTQPEILNEVTLANGKFLKVDQNGNKITSEQVPLQFTVQRIGEPIAGYPMGPDDIRTYTIDANGYLYITNLAIGIYEVIEDLSNLTAEQKEILTAGAQSVHFWIKVEATDGGQVQVSIFDKNPLDPSNTSQANTTVPHKGTADFTEEVFFETMGKLMKNVRAYGMVNLNKVRGEWLEDDNYLATEQALAEVEFAIFEADDVGNRKSDIPFIILTTDAQGNFPQPGADGIYIGTDEYHQPLAKALLAGNYVMWEWRNGADYVLLQEDIPFTILAQETTWIYTDGGGNKIATASDAASGKPFINVPQRGTLSFDKVDDSSGKYLTDAEFAICLEGTNGETGTKIGTICYNGATNTYQIADVVMPEILNESDIPYLNMDQAGVYHLLAGNYMIQETAAPDGYLLMAEKINISIKHNKNTFVTYPLSAPEGTVGNGIQKASIAFVKNVEVNPSQPEANGNETTFILRGTPANSDKGWTEKTFTASQLAGEDGRFDINDIPLGSYELYEQAADPNSYQGFGGAAEAKILEIIITAGANGIPEVNYTIIDTKEAPKSPAGITVIIKEPGTAGKVEIINNWKRGTVAGRKVSADNPEIGLADAVFGLYTDTNCTNLVTTAVSSTATIPEGQFVFTDIAYGIYYLKEIKAPVGYAPSTAVYKVIVDSQEKTIEEGGKLDEQNNAGEFEAIIFTNGNKRGAVELTKKAAHSGEVLAGVAEFTIYTDEACSDAVAYLRDSNQDGIYTLSSGSGLTATINGIRYLQADENGNLLLIQGTYWLKETTVPDGYQVEMEGGSQKIYKFTIHSEDDITSQLLDTYVITNRDIDESFYNDVATGQFTLAKTIQVSLADGSTAAGSGFWFELTRSDEAVNTEFLRIDGKTLTEAVAEGIAEEMEDGSIRVVTGSDGTIVISGLLMGTYMVTELDGPDYHLYIQTDPKIVVLKQSKNQVEIITSFDKTDVDPEKENLTFHNVWKRSDIKGLKVTTGGMGLTGAVIGLFPADTIEFSQSNLYEGKTAVSDGSGYFVFENIPYGTYRIAELAAPTGYQLNQTTSFLVQVTADGSEITIGYKEEKLVAETEESGIVIVNTKTTGGGGGSGGSGGGSGGGSSVSPDNPAAAIDESQVSPGENVQAGDGSVTSEATGSINENGVPLTGLARMGDTLPYALLATIMLGAIGGIGILSYYRRKENEE